MKLVNDLMFKFYEAVFNYYDEKAHRLNDEARELRKSGKEPKKVNNLDDKALNAAVKSLFAFEHCYHCQFASKHKIDFTMKSRTGVTYKLSMTSEES